MSPIDASSEILKVTGLVTNTGELSLESCRFIVTSTSESSTSLESVALTFKVLFLVIFTWLILKHYEKLIPL